MDHATLTDNNGRKADFRQVVLIMTSNAGSRELSNASIGFWESGASARAVDSRQKAAQQRSKQADREGLQPGVPQPARRDRLLRSAHAGGDGDHRREVRPAARGAARRAAHRHHARAGGARVARGKGLRPGVRRAAARAGDPDGGARSADRRNPVRPARTRRHGHDQARRRAPRLSRSRRATPHRRGAGPN